MDTRTSAGPVVIATSALPGDNSFRGSYETHVFPLSSFSEEGQLGVGDSDALSPGARAWADTLGASIADVGAYLLALGSAPSYAETFAEALESDIARFPAVTDAGLFREAVEVGNRLLQAWSLETPPRGRWQEAGAGVQLGGARMEGDAIVFENGDRLEQLHPETWSFSVSGYPVMDRYLEARAHLALTGELAEDIRRVAGAIAAILAEQAAADSLLERAIAAPSAAL